MQQTAKEVINLSLTDKVSTILNGTIHSVKTVIPLPIRISSPALTKEPFRQTEVGVIVGITGNIYGRLILSGEKATILELSNSVFGMAIDDSMLPSFAGELGNMIAGNIATYVSDHNWSIDITPPTILEGNNNIYGFEKAVKILIEVEGKGILTAVLALEDR